MKIEELRNHFDSFNKIRLDYKDSKKEIIMEYITTKNPELVTKLKDLQQTYHSEFLKFGNSVKDLIEPHSVLVSDLLLDDDYFFWLCFTLDSVINKNSENEMSIGIMKRNEWKNAPTFQ